MMNVFAGLIRKIRLIKLADKIRYYITLVNTYKLRKRFYKEYPKVKLPPPYYIYETFNLNYFSFYVKSIDTAKWLTSYFKKYSKLENLKILDWGCGPGRVIRHLPGLISNSCKFYGIDYNQKYIKWCSDNIPNITFKSNMIVPPLYFKNNSLDIIYGISIFTHLSEEMHFAWFNELIRVIKKGGIIFITLHGDAFKGRLSEIERKKFEQGNLIVRANTKEGHRTYAAFQPDTFVKELIGDNEVIEHVKGTIKNNKPEQDIWIIRKK